MAKRQKNETFDLNQLSEKEREDFTFIDRRIDELQDSRQDHYGIDLDQLWQDADKGYIPHRLNSRKKKVLTTDEDKGLRGQFVQVGDGNWQSDVSQSNPFVKIQTALSILIDQNPTGVFTSTRKQFQATTELIKQLYQRSWETAQSKEQLKLFVFNLAKYGWACARTYPLRLEREVNVLKELNQEDPSKNVYEKKTVVEYNDIMRENLDPRNTWIDDIAKPSNTRSLRDWCFRKVYDMDQAKAEFGKYPRWKLVKAGGNTEETVEPIKNTNRTYKSDNLVEVYFYENRVRDLFCVIANGVPVILEPLPISDNKGLKRLSLWQAYWNLRHAESPYGIGIYEAIRYDQGLLDRIRNMTIDQLTLSIYKMFFYQGTQQLNETGEIAIKPGVGKQVLDPKNIAWLQVPGPGQEAWQGIQLFRNDVDEASGITDPLLGQITGKTAFEIAQAKEAALKRLKNPLGSITDALNEEGYITISLIQTLYSIPETFSLSDPKLIDDYLKEIESNPELFSRDEAGQFKAIVYREFPLNLDKDEKGNLIETKDTKFFRVMPHLLSWEGIINIKSQSILTPSKQVDKALELEMYNILIPLLAQPPQIYNKVAKNILKLYEKEPADILPDMWLQDGQPAPQEEPLFVNANQPTQEGQTQGQPPAQGAEKFVSNTQLPTEPQGMVQKIMSKLTSPFR